MPANDCRWLGVDLERLSPSGDARRLMLKRLIQDRIRQDGFITVADYMQICLLHPEHGYYTTRTVFGGQGDFVTAPEISQLFGEMIGIWAVLEWQRMGQPEAFNLIECGPGRGTLMADLLRGVGNAKPFIEAAQIHLIEASPQLRDVQRQMVQHASVTWYDNVPAIGQPSIVIANEFLDALPIRQFVTVDQRWHERVIVLDSNEALIWSHKPDRVHGTLPTPQDQPDGTIYEYAQDAQTIFNDLCQALKKTSGAMTFIDYGDYVTPRFGDTLQAVKQHAFQDVLQDCGQADLTAHVDFYALDQIAQSHGLKTVVMNQGEFLKLYGIEQRLHVLLDRANDGAKDKLHSGYRRLTDPDQMGHLFKVLLVQTP